MLISNQHFSSKFDHYPKLYQFVSKQMVINAIEQDLKEFQEAQDKKLFVKKFIDKGRDDYIKHTEKKHDAKSYNVSSDEHVYSLLLIAAIRFNDIATVKHILSDDHGNILTFTDALGYSPLSCTLYSGNTIVLNQIKAYIEKNKLSKVVCNEDDKACILTVMQYPQFENLTKTDYIELLGPLYEDLTPFMDLLETFGI